MAEPLTALLVSAAKVVFHGLVLIIDLAYIFALALCEFRKLLKYGPRFWRVERQMRRRAWKRRQK